MLKTFLPRSIPSPSKRSQKSKYDRIWLKQDAKPTIFNFSNKQVQKKDIYSMKIDLNAHSRDLFHKWQASI